MKTIKSIFYFFNDDTPYYAASLSFFTIFAILPLIALLIVVISNIPAVEQHIDKIMLYILDFINPTHSSTFSMQIEKFLENTEKLGYIGLVYLLFVFTMFFKDYEYIINKIHKVQGRAIYKSFFLYLSFLIATPLLIFIFIFVSAFTQLPLIIDLFTSLFIWAIFIVLFIISVNKKVSFRAAAFSSLITIVTLSITKTLFGYYVSVNTTYATIYGSFSVALFFFLWIYTSWNIYLYGTKLCSILNKAQISDEN
ncbi:MAG: trehalose-6-phosphate synthase [Arcobacter sp.]|nr:MAG: trehalose-6-phosphate synthase [Arcobacter sp.]